MFKLLKEHGPKKDWNSKHGIFDVGETFEAKWSVNSIPVIWKTMKTLHISRSSNLILTNLSGLPFIKYGPCVLVTSSSD